jgi:hypothetical protein
MRNRSNTSTFVSVILFLVVFTIVSCLLIPLPQGLLRPSQPIPVKLNDAEWEAIVWMNAERTRAHGMAVRRRQDKATERKAFKAGAETPWGICDAWSPESSGKYCLISECELSDKGKLRYRTYIHRDIYDALP